MVTDLIESTAGGWPADQRGTSSLPQKTADRGLSRPAQRQTNTAGNWALSAPLQLFEPRARERTLRFSARSDVVLDGLTLEVARKELERVLRARAAQLHERVAERGHRAVHQERPQRLLQPGVPLVLVLRDDANAVRLPLRLRLRVLLLRSRGARLRLRALRGLLLRRLELLEAARVHDLRTLEVVVRPPLRLHVDARSLEQVLRRRVAALRVDVHVQRLDLVVLEEVHEAPGLLDETLVHVQAALQAGRVVVARDEVVVGHAGGAPPQRLLAAVQRHHEGGRVRAQHLRHLGVLRRRLAVLAHLVHHEQPLRLVDVARVAVQDEPAGAADVGAELPREELQQPLRRDPRRPRRPPLPGAPPRGGGTPCRAPSRWRSLPRSRTRRRRAGG